MQTELNVRDGTTLEGKVSKAEHLAFCRNGKSKQGLGWHQASAATFVAAKSEQRSTRWLSTCTLRTIQDDRAEPKRIRLGVEKHLSTLR
jgi:hypothetical protein